VKGDVSAAANACRRFFVMELEARIIAATLKVLGMQSIDDKPTENKYSGNDNTKTKKDYLRTIATKVVDTYIIDQERNQYMAESVRAIQQQEEQPNAEGRFLCRFPGCEKTFANTGKRRKDHEASHSPPFVAEPPYSQVLKPVSKEKDDDMFNYQRALLDYGMIILNCFDAIA